MEIDVYFTPGEVDIARVQERTVVVIDIVRFTTTLVEALAAGARGVYPAPSTEEAIRMAQSLGREDTLLCGERKAVKVEGFDLGNSPREFTPERVGDKRLVMSTTNGTRAFVAVQGAERVLAGAFTNLSAVAGSVRSADRLALVCAGRQDVFSLDDAVCAGRIVDEIVGENRGDCELNDGARASLTLAGRVTVDASFLRSTAAGRALEAVGLEDDLAVCAEVDRHGIVPEMHDRMIRVADGGS